MKVRDTCLSTGAHYTVIILHSSGIKLPHLKILSVPAVFKLFNFSTTQTELIEQDKITHYSWIHLVMICSPILCVLSVVKGFTVTSTIIITVFSYQTFSDSIMMV